MLPHRREFATHLKRIIKSMHRQKPLACSICQQRIEPWEQLTIDHWRGRHDNRPENAQPAHHYCNQRKGNQILPDNPVSLAFTQRLLAELAQDPYWQLAEGADNTDNNLDLLNRE